MCLSVPQCVAVHGDISQSQRTAAVEKFKSGEVPLLIATDVAARGLDIPDVEAVINYSFPLTTEDYVHRIGRTGRAGKTGTCLLVCICSVSKDVSCCRVETVQSANGFLALGVRLYSPKIAPQRFDCPQALCVSRVHRSKCCFPQKGDLSVLKRAE